MGFNHEKNISNAVAAYGKSCYEQGKHDAIRELMTELELNFSCVYNSTCLGRRDFECLKCTDYCIDYQCLKKTLEEYKTKF